MKEKLLAVLLSLTLVVSLASFTAFAEEQEGAEGMDPISEEAEEAPALPEAPVPLMEGEEQPVSIMEITGLRAPVAGESGDTDIDETDQYTGTVVWQDGDGNPFSGTFEEGMMIYKAIITLTPKAGYTFDSVLENVFTLDVGVKSVTNAVGSNVVEATFVTPPEEGEVTDGHGFSAYMLNGETQYAPLKWFYNEWKLLGFGDNVEFFVHEEDGSYGDVDFDELADYGLQATFDIDFSADGKSLMPVFSMENTSDSPVTVSISHHIWPGLISYNRMIEEDSDGLAPSGTIAEYGNRPGFYI